MLKWLKPKGSAYKILSVLKEREDVRVYKALRAAALRPPRRGMPPPAAALEAPPSPGGLCQSEVTVKIFPQNSELFYKERSSLQKAASIPACVRLLMAERFPQGPALILESIRGLTLRELLKGGPLREDEISFIMGSLGESLQRLSRCGLFHGDLSLSNVLLDAEGRIRLIDFGEANRGGEGTAPFTAPEILKGACPNWKSDLFSLGVIELFLSNPAHPLSYGEKISSFFDSSPLLMEDPKLRRFKPGRLCESPLSLREKCQTLLALKEGICETGKAAPLHRKKSSELLALTLMGLLLALPAPAAWRPPQTGFLTVRTDQWFHITVESFSGYAPFSIPLSSGSYRVFWQSRGGSGEKSLYIPPGKALLLNDRDFLPPLKPEL